MDKILKYPTFLFLYFFPLWLSAQSLSLEECYTLAYRNFPLAAQKELAAAVGAQKMTKANQNWWPKFEVQGQATWQNEVTQINLPISLPGVEIPEISKDQYRLAGELSQTIFDGGSTRRLREAESWSALSEQQKVAVEQYKLRERINQFYFSALLLDKQAASLDLVKTDLQNRIKKVEALYQNGVAQSKDVDGLKVELLKVEQQKQQMALSRKNALESLAELTGTSITPETQLVAPAAEMQATERPEVQLFTIQKSAILTQQDLLKTGRLPKLSAFAQAGVGRPGYNFLDNDPAFLFQAGLRLRWNLSAFYTDKKDREILSLSHQLIDNQQTVFQKNIDLQALQSKNEAERYREMLPADREILALRERIRERSAAQLDNGVLTASDYVADLNAWQQAQINLDLHELQALFAEINFRTTAGK